MSVGGEVIEVCTSAVTGNVWINTSDDGHTCAIYVANDENSRKVAAGDKVWWQGRKALWTTKDRKTQVDTALRRVGFSGAPRPVISFSISFKGQK